MEARTFSETFLLPPVKELHDIQAAFAHFGPVKKVEPCGAIVTRRGAYYKGDVVVCRNAIGGGQPRVVRVELFMEVIFHGEPSLFATLVTDFTHIVGAIWKLGSFASLMDMPRLGVTVPWQQRGDKVHVFCPPVLNL